MAIQGFARPQIEKFFLEGVVPRGSGWSATARVAARMLDLLGYAARLSDLRSPPGNRLEALKGDMDGFHSMRINQQWRVVFRWEDGGPTEVDIVDYHRG